MSETDIKILIAQTLKRIRKSAGISQDRMAEAIGVSKHTVRNYEDGTFKPPLEVSLAWCQICDYPSEEYVHDIYGVRIVGHFGEEADRQALIDYANEADPDELHMVAELVRRLKRLREGVRKG